jgi:hypothetical protein
LELEQYGSKLSSRERDLIRLAGFIHDGRKSGSQEDYESSKYTKFNHPVLMADVVRSFGGKYLSNEEIELVADTVSKHMGQWNVDSKTNFELPKPNNKYARMVHTADFLASRKCLTMDFDNYVSERVEIPDLATFVLPFGNKHKGELLVDIAKNDPSYIDWMRREVRREPFISLIKQLDEMKKEQ